MAETEPARPTYRVRGSGRKLHLTWGGSVDRHGLGGRTVCGRRVPDHWYVESAERWEASGPDERCVTCADQRGQRAVIEP